MKFFLTEDQITALRLFTACSCGGMARMEMVGFLKDLASISNFLYPSLRQKQKCALDYSSCKTLIGVFVLNFKVPFSAL